MLDIDKIRLTRWYKEYFPREFDAYKKGNYPTYDFFGSGYTVTWCPVCELQRAVCTVSFDWWHCDVCNCTFTKVTSYEK